MEKTYLNLDDIREGKVEVPDPRSVQFFDPDTQENIGGIFWNRDTIWFEGNMEESARLFFESVIQYADAGEFFKEKKE